MKRQLGSLGMALLIGVSISCLSAVVAAQQPPRASQQPMEIPAQQYPPYPGGPAPGYPDQQGQQVDTDSGAARLSYVHGDVSTQHSDSGDWVAATLNTPVVNGDHISTGQGARAEIQLDHANVLRMSDQSTANIVNLTPTQMQLQIGQGLVNFDVLRGSDADVEIQTPNVAIHPQVGEGSLRILVNSDGETIVDVRKGSAEISTPQGSTQVNRNQRITIQGDADNAQYQLSGAPGGDDWDKWNSDRDHVITSAESWQHTNPYYTGSQDLDAYGHWSDVPDYGSVWFPSTDPGWAPYRNGRWVYEPYYGWTWVSYEPWGWAPYHYGRWFVYGGNWGWWPGPVYGGYHPIWAPAYVSFLGFGGRGWGVSVGFGGGFGDVGWLPCGPGDRFYPWYGRGVNRVNVVNVYNIHNGSGGWAPLRGGPRGYSNVDRAFTDDRVRAGVSSMSSDQFGRGRVPRQQQRFDAASFRQASVMTGANPVSPSRESFHPSDRQIRPGAIPSRSTNQRFFSGNSRQGSQSQIERARGEFNRAGEASVPSQQNNVRPGFRSFGSGPRVNENPGSRPADQNPGGNQGQQNTASPTFERSGRGSRGFGGNNSGNPNRVAPPEQPASQPQVNPQGQRGFSQPPSQPAQPNPGPGSAWRTFDPRSSETQRYGGGRRFEGGQGGGQPQPGASQPTESPRQYQNQNYPRGSSNNGYSRPPLNMQQPVVTPRERTYSPAPQRSAPNPGASSGGGYRGGSSEGGSRGGYSGGGSRGGPSS